MAITITITNPVPNESVQQATIPVLCTITTDAPGATITASTVSTNGGTPLGLIYNASSGLYSKTVAIPNGAVTCVVRATDSTSATQSATVRFTNGGGAALQPPPLVNITSPGEGDVFGQAQLTASADVGSPVGVDSSKVEISVDGISWVSMALPPPGGSG